MYSTVAKHGRRKFRRYIGGAFELTNSLGGLADGDVVGGTPSQSVTEEAWLSSIKATFALRNSTAGEGPIVFGIAHSDYSDAEIEEYLENTGSWDAGDLVQQEIAKRKIRRIGVFDGEGSEEKYNEGRSTRIKCGWMLFTGDNFKIWMWNKSGASLTSGAAVMVEGKANLWPTG